jgi:hypothetical protein
MCFYHVLENLEKYFKVLLKKLDIKVDIRVLQTCPDEETFTTALDLFFKKWKGPEVEAMMSYFRTQWVEKNGSWFEGAGVGYSSTNNGIEATNAVIKRDHTLRARLPVNQFLYSAFELVEKWSNARNSDSVNGISFAHVRTHSLKHWTAAYQWAAKNTKVLQRDGGGSTSIF